jgi:hypothetical protein
MKTLLHSNVCVAMKISRIAYFWQTLPAISATEEKIQPPCNFPFLIFDGLAFKLKKRKERKQAFQKFSPFLALSVQNQPKFDYLFVLPLNFLFNPFGVMQPNIRPAGNTACKLVVSNSYCFQALHRIIVQS